MAVGRLGANVDWLTLDGGNPMASQVCRGRPGAGFGRGGEAKRRYGTTRPACDSGAVGAFGLVSQPTVATLWAAGFATAPSPRSGEKSHPWLVRAGWHHARPRLNV